MSGQIVYVVSESNYCGGGATAVFSTREAADRYVAEVEAAREAGLADDAGSHSVAEMEVDHVPDWPPRIPLPGKPALSSPVAAPTAHTSTEG